MTDATGRTARARETEKVPGVEATGTFLAETAGFEPANGLRRYHLSRVAH